jgi:hypothetical protein
MSPKPKSKMNLNSKLRRLDRDATTCLLTVRYREYDNINTRTSACKHFRTQRDSQPSCGMGVRTLLPRSLVVPQP